MTFEDTQTSSMISVTIDTSQAAKEMGRKGGLAASKKMGRGWYTQKAKVMNEVRKQKKLQAQASPDKPNA